jgi:NAD(P)-dependent dehydrogenase (short-subunit alcohol dehydrogenase family)
MNTPSPQTTQIPQTPQKVALVTGGSRGIGAATCQQLAKLGYAVVVNYASQQAAADAVCKAIAAQGGTALALQADVSDEAQVLAMFTAIDARFGRLDALVNNAGVVDMPSAVVDMSVARLTRMMMTNVIGSMVCAREAVRRMSVQSGNGCGNGRGEGRGEGGRHQGGAIVNLSSAAAKLGSPNQYVDYAASKGAIDSFTIGLAKEVAALGIRVNGVRPGIIDTDIHASGGLPDRVAQMASQVPMQRGGSASEVAEAICWLLSDAASYVTGTTIDVTGGR